MRPNRPSLSTDLRGSWNTADSLPSCRISFLPAASGLRYLASYLPHLNHMRKINSTH